ncbi:MAG TPA: CCA tRNA nucleotidyltransferase [Polyangiaceae bacterium]
MTTEGTSGPRPASERAAEQRRRRAAGTNGEREGPSRSAPPVAARPKPKVYPIKFDPGRVDPDAAKVVHRLARNGYEAYLVGGCVRDLLINRSPKDFDVATSARPDDVRRLFRNSRIIGRRFRLVHVLFSGGKVIETATFRRNPLPTEPRPDEDLLIRNDNVFGEAHEDAQRRDFTINGLFYDLEECQVIDWVEGMPDIERRSVDTIGDPVVRFLEDPVRILRAIKFSARLDLGIAPDVFDAVVQCRGALAMAAKPRLFEEMLRLMRGGAAHRSIWLAWETGVLDVLLPELSTYLSDEGPESSPAWQILRAVDRRTGENSEPLDDIVLWCALLLYPMSEACDGARDRVQAAVEFLEPVVDRLNVPRRIADAVRRIVALFPRLATGRAARFSRSSLYPLALEVFELMGDATPRGDDQNDTEPSSARPRPRKRRRGRRKRRTEAGSSP